MARDVSKCYSDATQKTMNLPLDLQHFPSATLLVISNSESAKFWLLGGDAAQELDGLSLLHEHAKDRETLHQSGNQDEDRFHRYLHDLTDRIAKLTHAHAIAHIHLVMPSEIEHAVTSLLPQDIRLKINKRVHADVMNESLNNIIRRVLGA